MVSPRYGFYPRAGSSWDVNARAAHWMCMSAPARSAGIHAHQTGQPRFAMTRTGWYRIGRFPFRCLCRCRTVSGRVRVRPATSTACCLMIAPSGKKSRRANMPRAPASLTCWPSSVEIASVRCALCRKGRPPAIRPEWITGRSVPMKSPRDWLPWAPTRLVYMPMRMTFASRLQACRKRRLFSGSTSSGNYRSGRHRPPISSSPL
jgi:hypothetical protein